MSRRASGITPTSSSMVLRTNQQLAVTVCCQMRVAFSGLVSVLAGFNQVYQAARMMLSG